MTEYQRHKGGRGWRYAEDGYILIEKEEGVPRTKGRPRTMEVMLEDFREELEEASGRFGFAVAELMAIVALESVPIKGTFHRDPASYRWEKRLGEPSVGLVQTLISTAKETNAALGLGFDVTEETLKDPRTSILLGAGYLSRLAKRWKTTDVVKLQAAYNAGGIYTSNLNRWRMRTNAPDRTGAFIRWHNDALAVLKGDT